MLAALAAGLFAAILMTPLQYRHIIPIILHAETYEGVHSHGDEGAIKVDATKPQSDHAHSDDSPHQHAEPTAKVKPVPTGKESMSRIWNTILANMVMGGGYGLLMIGVSLASGIPVTVASGLVWGALGWLSVQLLPALGLPPELPGFPHVELVARQYWWVCTVFASVVGFWCALRTNSNSLRIFGALILIVPHAYGAPQPVDLTSAVPAYLAAQYAVASLSTMLFFWLALGLALGWAMDRMKLETR